MMFGAGALMLALVQVGNSGEMATIASLAADGVVALLALAAHERGAAEPVLPLKLWRDRVIAVGSLSGFTGGMVMMSINAKIGQQQVDLDFFRRALRHVKERS